MLEDILCEVLGKLLENVLKIADALEDFGPLILLPEVLIDLIVGTGFVVGKFIEFIREE